MSYEDFKAERESRILGQSTDSTFQKSSREWFSLANKHNYSYNFEWQGRPIIQYPQDIIALQEVVFEVKPDIIIETGIAHGGSVVLSASLLSLLDVQDGVDPRASSRKVIGIDIDIRPYNRDALEGHPLSFKMDLVEESSTEPEVVGYVQAQVDPEAKVLVLLDSNHTHDHVLSELQAYGSLVSEGSYVVVYDTVIENLTTEPFSDRPWSVGNSPGTAVSEWLNSHPDFVIDSFMDNKLLVSVAPGGWLKRTAKNQ